jgi:type II secretory pathway component PulF
MAVVGAGTIAFMLLFVIPKLTQIVVSAGQELPLPTRLLISASSVLSNPWLWIGIAVCVLLARRQLAADYARLPLGAFLLKLPLAGQFIIKSEIARFSRTLELLIKNGIPILQALRIAIPVLSNEAVKVRLEKSCLDLEQGGSFGMSLKNARIFPPFMTNLVTVGEESGKLADALAEVAEAYEKDVERSMKAASSIMEPLMILALGLIVGFIVVAMLLPVFQINVMSQ